MLRLSLRTAGWLIVGFMLGMASAQAREVLASSPTELRAALKAPAPGDVIVLRDGDWPDSEIRFRGEGTPDRPITLRAQTVGDALRLTRAFSASFAQDKPIALVDIEGEDRRGVYYSGCDQFSDFQGANWPLTKSDVGPGSNR